MDHRKQVPGMSKLSAAERRHLGRIKTMRCILCEILDQEQELPTEAHHPRFAVGAGMRADHYLAIPLCGGYQAGCHSSSVGIHGDRSLLRIAKVSEEQLLADTVRKLVEAG